MKIVITVPDSEDTEEAADYVAYVASQLEEGFTSGHVNAETHWSLDFEGTAS